MSFINPFMLWGITGIAIPVFIHIWNKKKGIVLNWATSQWLFDKSQQQHRGMRLDNIMLLIIRCLLIILLAVLLGQPVIHFLNTSRSVKKVHLVEPTDHVVQNYRFELETALKKGERVYWIAHFPQAVSTLSLPEKHQPDPLMVQKSISSLEDNGEELNLYLSNTAAYTSMPAMFVPEHFQLHTAVNSTERAVADFKTMPAIHVLLDYTNPSERQTVRSALDALIKVYSFPITIDFDQKAAKSYDLVLTDKKQKRLSAKTLYLFSGAENPGFAAPVSNVLYSPEPFHIQSSEMVRSGKLPEWLGEILIRRYKQDPNVNQLSYRQFSSLFVKTGPPEDKSWIRLQKCLIAAFTILLLLERSIALKKMNV